MTAVSSLQIIGSKHSGGAERFYARLTAALAESGDKTVAVYPPRSDIAPLLPARLPQRTIAMRGVWDPIAKWALQRVISQHAPDIVQTWMGRATRLIKLPVGRLPLHIARLGGYYDLKGYRHAHAWVGNTKGICDYLIKGGLPSHRVFHISNFIEPIARPTPATLNSTRAQWSIPEDAYVIFSAGRLHPNKGFSDLLTAFANLPSALHQRPLRLALAGDGPLRESLFQQAESLGISARIRWCGWQQDLTPLLGLADVFVCPSVHEPLGNVILEAWAQHVPVIATATDGARELITHETNGIVTPVSAPQALGDAILNLLNASDTDRLTLASAGYQALITHHGRAAVVQAYRSLYQDLVHQCAA